MRKLMVLLLLGAACGAEREVPAPGGSASPPARPAPGGDLGEGAAESFADIKADIIDVSCKRCHTASAFIKTEPAWLASSAATRVASKNMPPASSPEARSLSAADRQRLVNF